jgi:hypothetical protein
MSIRHLLVLVPSALIVGLAAFSCTQTPPGSTQGTTARPAATQSAPAPGAAAPSAPANAAANVTGTWTWTYDGGDAGMAITHTYILKQSGETVTGTFKDSFDETTADIKEGKIHDGQVSFKVSRPLMDNTMDFTFTGRLQGDTIKGTATWTMMDQPTTSDWLAKRSS